LANTQPFTALHVISDLHLSSRKDHQIFKGAEELRLLIERLSSEGVAAEQARRVGLVINGDFIDFLADPNATYFDPANARDKLDAVVREFADVWQAFNQFVSRQGNELIIVLGNHDLELALSDVKRHLVDSIAKDNAAARGRIQLAMDGTGFAARVGDAGVMCVHGNEVDTFNIVDYERLRRIDRDLQLGWNVSEWVPNAGTKLVIDIMNGIKSSLPFVDLLKPETEAVVPILFALEQASRERLSRAIAVGGRLAWDKLRRHAGLLSGEETDAAQREVEPPSFEELIASALPRSSAHSGRDGAADAMLLMTEERFRNRVDPLRLIGQSGEQSLGYTSAIWKKLQGKDTAEILLEALERVQKDQSFDPSALDATFKDIDHLISPDYRYVIAGHTHLERILRRRRGGGTYMNTGTWARLIRLRPDDLISIDQFRPIFAGLRAKTMPELDEALPTRIIHRPAVASVWLENGVPCHALNRVKRSGGNLVSLEPVGEA
jgi:UDP-2,3-diacylglucosamine pyrophosphatase LpxH